MRYLTWAIGFSLALSMDASSHAATLVAEADTYAQRSVATNNFGQAPVLLLKNNPDDFVRKSWVRFDTSSLNSNVDTASLRLNFVDTGLGGGGTTINWEFEVYGLNDGDPGEGWVEGTGQTGVAGATPPNPLTWNNAPANNTANGNGILANAISLGTFDLLGTTGSVDFTSSALIDFLNDDTDGEATFILTRNTPQPDGGNNYVHGVASIDQTAVAGPTLDLALLAVPEPASIALWLLLGLGLGVFGYRVRPRR